jgi:hypothetical protein
MKAKEMMRNERWDGMGWDGMGWDGMEWYRLDRYGPVEGLINTVMNLRVT